MTLAELAALVDAPPKWVLNTIAVLDVGRAYTFKLARTLVVIRALQEDLELPLANARALARRLLDQDATEPGVCFVPAAPGADVVVGVDVHRLIASLHVRRSSLLTLGLPRRRGRPPKRRRDPLAAAREWGVDLSLLQANLRRTPAERLRQLDSMVRFSRQVRRIRPERTADKPG